MRVTLNHALSFRVEKCPFRGGARQSSPSRDARSFGSPALLPLAARIVAQETKTRSSCGIGCPGWVFSEGKRLRGASSARQIEEWLGLEASIALLRHPSWVMGKILPFKPLWDGSEDMEALLREFFAAERELEIEEVDPEIVHRAKEIPWLMSLLPPLTPGRGDRSPRERRQREKGSRRWFGPVSRFEL